MLLKTFALAAASTFALGTAAMAQTSADAPTTVNPMPEAAPAYPSTSSLPPIGSSSTAPLGSTSNVSATVTDASPTANPPGTVLAGTELVASAPVPDTRENRAKFGSPMSNAGKRTAPAGN